MSPAPASTNSPAPQSSALPPSQEASNEPQNAASNPPGTSASAVKPSRKPLLRLELRDLSSEGSRAFLRLLHASSTLEDAVDTVLKHLYSGLKTDCIPPTRSITLVLRGMDGVAYTTGLDLDDDHKEIHFSTDYINAVADSRKKEEMQGVIVHEMVHCWQHNALGTAPGGLIEGIADWVRLKAGFAPPHWKRRSDCDWDAGYERTGYFLEWLEQEHGEDVVRRINEGLRGCKYEADAFWEGCCGKDISKLWEEYKTSLGGEEAESAAADQEETKTTEQETAGDEPADDAPQEAPSSSKDEDHRTPQQKSRRGGRMHVPVRPGNQS